MTTRREPRVNGRFHRCVPQLGSFPSDLVKKVEANESVGIGEQLVVQGEVFFGQNPLINKAGDPIDLTAGDDFARAWAFQVVGGWAFPIRGSGFIRAIQPIFRATFADPNTDQSNIANWGLTPGVQIFFAQRQKLALNWDIVIYQGDLRGVNSFKGQYQFYF